MDDSEKLDRILKLTEENNRKIRSLYRAQIWSTIRSVIYWALIIGLGIGAFYYLQPYLNKLNEIVHIMTGGKTDSFLNLDIGSLKQLVN